MTPTRIWPACSQYHQTLAGRAGKTLTDDDAADFEIVDGVDPPPVADFERLPAGGEDGLEEWLDVADGEQDVTGFILRPRQATRGVQAYPSSRRPAPGMTKFLK